MNKQSFKSSKINHFKQLDICHREQMFEIPLVTFRVLYLANWPTAMATPCNEIKNKNSTSGINESYSFCLQMLESFLYFIILAAGLPTTSIDSKTLTRTHTHTHSD